MNTVKYMLSANKETNPVYSYKFISSFEGMYNSTPNGDYGVYMDGHYTS